MKYLLLFLSLIVCTAGSSHANRVYGGQNATSGQFPFMVALNSDGDQFCSGIVLNPSWILTTSSCIYGTSATAEVYAGSHVNLVNGTAYRFFERVTHREYDDWTMQNDIALIRINAVLEYGDTIQPIELGTSPAPNSTCTIVGWGASDIETNPTLQYLETTTIDLELCQNISAENLQTYYLGPEQVCTLQSTGQGPCYGDQGGALVCDGKLSGIFSYTIAYWCAGGLPDVFTSIESYSDWILSYIER